MGIMRAKNLLALNNTHCNNIIIDKKVRNIKNNCKTTRSLNLLFYKALKNRN